MHRGFAVIRDAVSSYRQWRDMSSKPIFILVEFLQKHVLGASYYKPGNRAYIRDHIAEDLISRGIAGRVEEDAKTKGMPTMPPR